MGKNLATHLKCSKKILAELHPFLDLFWSKNSKIYSNSHENIGNNIWRPTRKKLATHKCVATPWLRTTGVARHAGQPGKPGKPGKPGGSNDSEDYLDGKFMERVVYRVCQGLWPTYLIILVWAQLNFLFHVPRVKIFERQGRNGITQSVTFLIKLKMLWSRQ